MRELGGERAVGAVTEVFEAEVLVDLEESLMLPGEAQMRLCKGEGAEESFAAAFYFLVGRGGTNFGEVLPLTTMKRVERVDEEFFET